MSTTEYSQSAHPQAVAYAEALLYTYGAVSMVVDYGTILTSDKYWKPMVKELLKQIGKTAAEEGPKLFLPSTDSIYG